MRNTGPRPVPPACSGAPSTAASGRTKGTAWTRHKHAWRREHCGRGCSPRGRPGPAPWRRPRPHGARPALANDPARNHPRQSARRDEHARSTSTRDARRSSRPPPPPPSVSRGGGTQLKRLRYVKPAGRAQAALPALPAPPSGSHRARGGTRSPSATRASRTPGRTRTCGGGSAASPPPLPPLPGAGGHFRGHLTPADGGTGGVISQRGGRRPPPRGPRTPPKGGGGIRGLRSNPTLVFRGAARRGRRRRWGTPQGGDRRCRLTAIPQGTAPGGRRRRHPLHGRSRNPPQGQSQDSRQSPYPLPPHRRGRSGRGAKGWGSRGAPCRPCAMSTGPSVQVMQRAQGGAALLQPPPRRASQGVGGGTTVSAGPEGGAAAAATSGRLALRRVGGRASPHDQGGRGRPSRAADGGVARGGTQGPGQGHGRASEEGT